MSFINHAWRKNLDFSLRSFLVFVLFVKTAECFVEIFSALAFMLRQIYISIRCQIALFHGHRSPEGTDEPICSQVACTQRSRWSCARNRVCNACIAGALNININIFHLNFSRSNKEVITLEGSDKAIALLESLANGGEVTWCCPEWYYSVSITAARSLTQ